MRVSTRVKPKKYGEDSTPTLIDWDNLFDGNLKVQWFLISITYIQYTPFISLIDQLN